MPLLSVYSWSWAWSSRGRELRQRIDHAVGRITAPWLGQVRQKLQREAHQRRPGHPVPRRELHHPWVADGPDELAPESVVAPVCVPERLGVSLQDPLATCQVRPGEGLSDHPPGDLAA